MYTVNRILSGLCRLHISDILTYRVRGYYNKVDRIVSTVADTIDFVAD